MFELIEWNRILANNFLYYIFHMTMSKRLKITLYIILILIIIAVVWLMFWNSKQVWESSIDDMDYIDENVNKDIEDTQEIQPQAESFDADVMKDLEWFFGNNNWYENLEWEFWFNNLENE